VNVDPLFVANEGKLVAMVEPSAAGAILAAMRSAPCGGDAGIPGRVVEAHPRMAILKTEKGGSRILDLPICRTTAPNLLRGAGCSHRSPLE
jgi:hydrogenase expression/formation protein HypE